MFRAFDCLLFSVVVFMIGSLTGYITHQAELEKVNVEYVLLKEKFDECRESLLYLDEECVLKYEYVKERKE